MADKEALIKLSGRLQDGLNQLADEINNLSITNLERSKIVMPFREVSYLSGVAMGTVSRHQDIAEELSLKLNKTIKGIDELLPVAGLDKGSKLILEHELLVLKSVLAELKKIGFD